MIIVINISEGRYENKLLSSNDSQISG